MAHPQFVQQLLDALPTDVAAALQSQPTEVLVAVFVVLSLLLAFLLFSMLTRTGRKSGSLIVLAGPCNSGKTSLFLQLRDGSTHSGTVASMQENSGVVRVLNAKGRPSGTVTLLDVPGHERLRHKLEQHLKEAVAVVFVVDAVDVTPHKVLQRGRASWEQAALTHLACYAAHRWRQQRSCSRFSRTQASRGSGFPSC
jgi:hypothetical protein